MKKWFSYLTILLLVGSAFMVSCSKDEEGGDGPTLTLKQGANYVSENQTIAGDEDILVGVDGASGDAALTRFKFVAVVNNVPQDVVDSTFNNNTFDWEMQLSFSGAGEYVLQFELWDANGAKDTKEITVTVEVAASPVNRYDNIELGSWNDEIGSFYSTSENLIYTVGQSVGSITTQGKIDFIFFKGTTNENSIASPDDASVQTISTFRLSEWAAVNKNETRFNTTTMTAAQFDAIGETYQFPAFDTSTQKTIINNLTEGQVIMFKTEQGKLGLIKVFDLYTRGDRASIDVIVQQ